MDGHYIESSETDSPAGESVLLSFKNKQFVATEDEEYDDKNNEQDIHTKDGGPQDFKKFMKMKHMLDVIHVVLTDKEESASCLSDNDGISSSVCVSPPATARVMKDTDEDVVSSSSEESGSTVKAWRVLTDHVRKHSKTSVTRKGRKQAPASAYTTSQKRGPPPAHRAAARPSRRSSRATVRSQEAASPAVDSDSTSAGDRSAPTPLLPPLPPLSTAGMLRRAAERGAAPLPGARPLIAARRSVACRIVGPILAELDSMPPSGLQPPSGVVIVDIHFHMPTNVSEVVFRNHYTASLSLLVRAVHYTSASRALASTPTSPSTSQRSDAGEAGGDAGSRSCHEPETGNSSACAGGEQWPWETSVTLRILMDDPHCENSAQDYCSVLSTESLVPWRHLLSMRLVLRQPSPNWLHHTVRDVTVYSEPPPSAIRGSARRLFASDSDAQEHSEAWRTIRLNTVNSMTPAVYRPRTTPGSQVLPDYEITAL